MYVGETKRTLQARFLNHFQDISSKDKKKPVALHFNQSDHRGTRDMKIHILEFLQTPPDDKHLKHREKEERKWQDRLRTSYPWGMNREDALPWKAKPP